MEEKKMNVTKDFVRSQIEKLDYLPSIKKLHLISFDLRSIADDLAKNIQKDFPDLDDEIWDNLLKSFDKVIEDCMCTASMLFPYWLNTLPNELKEENNILK